MMLERGALARSEDVFERIHVDLVTPSDQGPGAVVVEVSIVQLKVARPVLVRQRERRQARGVANRLEVVFHVLQLADEITDNAAVVIRDELVLRPPVAVRALVAAGGTE